MKRRPTGGRLLVLDETTLRHLPPRRAAWALRAQPAGVRISGAHVRRSLSGAWDLRTGRRVRPGAARRRLAARPGIRLLWLPRQHPEPNPVDHLWRGLKNTLAANRQFAGVDELAAGAEKRVRTLTPTRTLRKAGLLSRRCCLKEVRRTLCLVPIRKIERRGRR